MILRIPQKEQRLFSFGELMVLLILLLSFMDFYLYNMHLMVIAFALFCLVRMRIPVANGVIPALLMSVALIFFTTGSLMSPTVWMKCLVWPAAYLLGYGFMWEANSNGKRESKAEKRANILLATIAAGFLIHLLLNLHINWGNELNGRNTVDIWLQKNRAATGQAGLACIPVAFFATELIKKRKLAVKVLAVLALVAMMYYNLTLGSRTMIVILLLQMVIVFVHSFMHREQTKRKNNGWVVLLVILIAAVIIYNKNMWGIRETIEDSILFARLEESIQEGISSDSRWGNKLKFLKYMPQYLFGGKHIYALVGSHAHDVLLDTYDEAGFLALIAVIALLCDGVAKLIRLFSCKGVQGETKITILCIYCSCFITFAVEPILAGMPWLLVAYCFINGMVTGLVKQHTAVSYGRYHVRN